MDRRASEAAEQLLPTNGRHRTPAVIMACSCCRNFSKPSCHVAPRAAGQPRNRWKSVMFSHVSALPAGRCWGNGPCGPLQVLFETMPRTETESCNTQTFRLLCAIVQSLCHAALFWPPSRSQKMRTATLRRGSQTVTGMRHSMNCRCSDAAFASHPQLAPSILDHDGSFQHMRTQMRLATVGLFCFS